MGNDCLQNICCLNWANFFVKVVPDSYYCELSPYAKYQMSSIIPS